MKKRILSIVLTVLMTVSMFALYTLPASAASMDFTIQPVVLMGGGGEYNIVWGNNVAGVGYVTYTYNGKKYTVYDEENGVVRSDDNIHTVRIPQKHLDSAGSYTVNAASVSSRDGYNITLGDSVQTSRSFKGYAGQDKVTIAIMSDTHYAPNDPAKKAGLDAFLPTAASQYYSDVDLLILNGDIADELQTENDYLGLFHFFDLISQNGTKPILYTMGNHEKRGFYSKELEKYLVFSTGHFYDVVDFGPLSMIVLDCGEDKEDDSKEYGGLVDYDHYFDEQLNWLNSISGYSDGSTYNLAISHGPMLIGRNADTKYFANHVNDYFNIMEQFGTDFLAAGHVHLHQWYDVYAKGKPYETPFPVLIEGEGMSDKQVKFKSSKVSMDGGKYLIKGIDSSGATAFEVEYEAGGNESKQPESKKETTKTQTNTYTQVETAAVTTTASAIPTAAGISTGTIKAAAGSTAITTKPVVFDAGIYFDVVWQTTPGLKCAGYVEIQGDKTPWLSSHGGKLRTETTHSVRIPKEKLSGKTYTVKSRVVGNYNAYGYHNGGDVDYGPYATGSAIKFNAMPTSKTAKLSIVAVANKQGGKTDGADLKSKLKTKPNLLVLAGNMAPALNTEADFGKYILEYAAEVTDGTYPVMFLRGEGETKGAFAANLPRILRGFTQETVSNRFYTSTIYGTSYALIGLDTATTKADSDSAYHGYASFDKLRKEQATWLENSLPKSFKSDYNIVFANASNLANCVGVDLTKNFEGLSVDLVVSAGGSKAEFASGGSGYSQTTVGASGGIVITCENDSIKVESTDNGAVLGTVNTKDVTYKGEVVTPPIVDGSSTPSTDNDSDNNTDSTPGNTDTNTDNNDNTPSGEGSYVSGDGNYIDGSIYIRDVEEGWYEDYLLFDIEITDDDIEFDKDITEGQFIYVVSRLAGINDALYNEDTKEDSASAWAEDIGISSSYMGSDDVISASTANGVVKAIFA